MTDLAARIVEVVAKEISLAVLMSETERQRLEAAVRGVLESHGARGEALEQVAEAARADVGLRYGLTHRTPGQYAAENSDWISDHGRAVLEALATLEALEET